MTIPKSIRDQIILDAMLGMTAEQIAEKYDTSVKVIRRIAKGHFTKIKPVKVKPVKKKVKKKFDGLKNLGMDYVKLRLEK